MNVDQVTRVIVVEDEPLFRELVANAVGSRDHLDVVATFGAGEDAIVRAPTLAPDVALLDIELGDGINGVQVGLKLRQRLPNVGIVLLSSYANPDILAALPETEAGGWSYLLKNSVRDIDTVANAIWGAANGQLTIDPQLLRTRVAQHDSRIASLTPRQTEILKLVAEGLSNSAIAERLVLAPKSVENHINTLYTRLGINSSDRHVTARVKAARIYLQDTTG